MEEQNDNKGQEDSQPQYKTRKIISRRRFLLNTGIFIGGATAILAGSSAVFYNAALRNKKNDEGIEEPTNNLVLLGNKSEFDNMNELTKVNYQTEVQDAWVTREIEGMVYINKTQNNELIIMSPICTHLGCTVPFASEKDQKSKPNLALKCPCHGGEFDEWGRIIGGPPPRPLDIYRPVVQGDKLYFDYYSLKQRKS
jgi:menaquinol-cytochrome c reductase iron-sulfur subunit